MLKRLTLGFGAALALLALAAGPAAANTIHVHAGGSIQDAVDQANPGDVIVVDPGVYNESVRIKENDITLRGSGPGKHGSQIKPAAHDKHCQKGNTGVCIVGRKHNGHQATIVGDRLTGFRISGFKFFGAETEKAKHVTFRNDAFIHDGEYGVAAFGTHATHYISDLAVGGKEAGFYVGDSPHAAAVLRNDVARHNGSFGFFLRDSAHGVVTHNKARRNCLGIGLVNTGAPGGARDWLVTGNRSDKNNRFCPGSEEGPPISGTGIGLIGASGNKVRHNHVFRNKPSGPGAFAPGGIVLASSVPLGGTPASNNTIARNRAFHNQPADIVAAGAGSGNKFPHNKCGKSIPGNICH